MHSIAAETVQCLHDEFPTLCFAASAGSSIVPADYLAEPPVGRRLSRVLIHWHQVAEHKAVLRQLLGNCLDTRRSKQLKQTVQAWQNHLAERVAKRMNQLSALLHWEQSLLKKAVAVWKLRTAVWRWK